MGTVDVAGTIIIRSYHVIYLLGARDSNFIVFDLSEVLNIILKILLSYGHVATNVIIRNNTFHDTVTDKKTKLLSEASVKTRK